jgi:hypothetical protein
MRLLCLSITYSGLPQTWELHTRTKVRQVTRLITIVDSVWWSQWGTCGTCGTSCFPVALSSLQRRGSIAAHMASKEKTREELSVRGLDTGCWWMYAERFSRWIIFRLYMLLCSLSFSVFELTAVRFTHRSLALVACKISIQTSTAEVFPLPLWRSTHEFPDDCYNLFISFPCQVEDNSASASNWERHLQRCSTMARRDRISMLQHGPVYPENWNQCGQKGFYISTRTVSATEIESDGGFGGFLNCWTLPNYYSTCSRDLWGSSRHRDCCCGACMPVGLNSSGKIGEG